MKRILTSVALFLGLSAATFFYYSGQVLPERMRSIVFDSYQSIFPRETGLEPVRLVEIDDRSIAEVGSFPWPRDRIAAVVDRLFEDGADVVVLNLLLRDRDPQSPSRFQEFLTEQGRRDLARVVTLTDTDELLARSLRRGRSVIGYLLSDIEGNGVPDSTASFARVSVGGPDGGDWNAARRFGGSVLSLPMFNEAAAGQGAFNIVPDRDGVVRRVPLILTVAGHPVPHVSAEALRIYSGASTNVVKTHIGGSDGMDSIITEVKIGEMVLPTDRTGHLWVHFGEPGNFSKISASDVLNGSYDAESVKGGIVVVGQFVTGFSKGLHTPLGAPQSGSAILAQVIEQMVSGRFMTRPDWAAGGEILAGVLFGLAMILLIPRFGALWGAVIGIAGMAAPFVISYLIFATGQLLFDPVFPMVAVLVTSVATTSVTFFNVDRRYTALSLMQERLRRAKEEAEYANRAKSEFLAHMSHEVRTPLNAIVGFSDIFAQEAHGPLGSDQYVEHSKDLQASAKHLLAVINDILDQSKVEAGAYTLVEEPVDLHDCLMSAVRLVRERAQSSGVSLVVEEPPGLIAATADERVLKQILLNLLTNAIKFTPTGGSVTGRVFVEEDDRPAIQIADTGIGIAKEDIPIVMDPFGQIDSEQARKHKGTGLGLPLAKSLIELHGGDLTLDSVPDEGTVASVHLPASRLHTVS